MGGEVVLEEDELGLVCNGSNDCWSGEILD